MKFPCAHRPFLPFAFEAATALALIFWLSLLDVRAASPAVSAASLRFVSPAGLNASNDCTSSLAPCRTVQHAVDSAQDGDEIRVAAGTYSGTMALNFAFTSTVVITKNLAALLGGYAPDFSTRDPVANVSVLSAGAYPSGFVLFISGTSTLVDGFSITGGQSSDLYFGSGIRVRGGAPTISHNRIYGNYTTSRGAAIYLASNAAATIAANRIYSNTAEERAGGIFVQGGTSVITANVIISNVARAGGGGISSNNAQMSVLSNTIAFNQAISPTGQGGGVFVDGPMPVTVKDNELYANVVTGGGSALDIRSPAIVDGNLVHHNQASAWGGAILVADSTSAVTLTNNVVVTNNLSGIWTTDFADVRVWNNTLAQNQESGVTVYLSTSNTISPSLLTLYNNIIRQNGSCGVSATDGGRGGLNLTIDYNDVYQNAQNYCGLAAPPSGANNISLDPQFVNAALGDYHIRFGSPAMDSGINTYAPATDKDGLPRPQGSRVDMGAYEVLIFRLLLPAILK